jgi:pyruvate-formate lyase-activating enzyme
MKEPEHYYATMSSILGRHKANATTNKQIRDLLHRVCKLLHCWHEVFHTLRSEKREIGWEVSLSLQISKAIKLHCKLGLRITPKVHTMEDHTLRQAEKMDLSFFYLIEEFVEQNHQTGHKEEERVKRIPNTDKRATAKAECVWIELNPEVQQCIQAVANHGSRKPYNTTKKQKLEEISPSPFRGSDLLCGSPSWGD